MEKRRKEREKEHIAKRKKGKVNNVTYASRLEAAIIGRIDDSFWKVKTKEEDKNNQQHPKAVANKQKQKAANATKVKDAEEQDTIAWESEEMADGVQALREYIKELGGSGNLIQAIPWYQWYVRFIIIYTIYIQHYIISNPSGELGTFLSSISQLASAREFYAQRPLKCPSPVLSRRLSSIVTLKSRLEKILNFQ